MSFIPMFYVYLMKSLKSGQLYLGLTNNLQKRLSEHRRGASNYTRKYRPYTLVYYEAYRSESDARKREASLKLRANALNQLKRRLVESLKTH